MFKKERVASLIQEKMAEFIKTEAFDFPMITVTRVSLSSNMKEVLVLVSVYPETESAKALAFLKRKRSQMKHHLKENTKLGRLPFIEVELDKGEKNRQTIDKIIQNTQNQSGSEE